MLLISCRYASNNLIFLLTVSKTGLPAGTIAIDVDKVIGEEKVSPVFSNIQMEADAA